MALAGGPPRCQAESVRARLPILLVALLCLAADAPLPLRVGTSGDYAPFSIAAPGDARSGFDVDLVAKLAPALGRSPEFVGFRWQELAQRAQAGTFDLVASGVTIRPDRVLLGRFTRPYAVSEAVVLIRRRDTDRFADLAALDVPTSRIAVNRGGYLESLARARFRQARIEPVDDNRGLAAPLERGDAEAVLTDSIEQERLFRDAPVARLASLTRDRKAIWVPRSPAGGGDSTVLHASVDRWLAQNNGAVDELRRTWLGAGNAMPADTARAEAIAALVDQRNGMAPWIAAAKRAKGLPIEDLEREKKVLSGAAERARAAGLPEQRVVDLFAALIEASKDIQRASGPVEPPVELETLRLVLGELDERLVAELAAGPLDAAGSERLRLEIEGLPGLGAERKQELSRRLAAITARR